MPSASAKTEKSASLEASDPVKQLSITLEKKVRNLEKRKQKLDNYKNDVQNGKELNEDQKNAVSKYDQVIEFLEYSKDLYKSLNAISQESVRVQKKLAKKEQIERQQHEIQRLQEALYYRHILSSLETQEIRNDFMTGENGALKLSEDDLHHLSQFYKLISSELPNDQADIEGHFHTLAENLIFLVDGKNKDIAGTTYKTLKDLLKVMKDSGYFSRTVEPSEEVSSDEIPEVEDIEKTEENLIETIHSSGENDDNPEPAITPHEDSPESVPEHETNNYTMQNGSLQEVLASQGSFNFLQESQIELDTPHMDPAVVAVHQIAPPSTMNFTQYPNQVEENLTNGIGDSTPPSMAIVSNAVPRSLTQHNGSPDFDPSHPIPTQTYTNQSFAIMQNLIVPPTGYVPVTMHHGHMPPPPHMTPIAVMPGLSPTVSSPPNSVPVHVTTVPIINDTNSVITNAHIMSPKETNGEIPVMNGISPELNQNLERPSENEGFVPSYQRGPRNRGRGRGQSNNYYRGRGSYNNGRGGYQSHNNNYQPSGGYRRGPFRGRGNNTSRGGRGNYNNNRTMTTTAATQEQQ